MFLHFVRAKKKNLLYKSKRLYAEKGKRLYGKWSTVKKVKVKSKFKERNKSFNIMKEIRKPKFMQAAAVKEGMEYLQKSVLR